MSSNSPPITAVEAGSHSTAFVFPFKDVVPADAVGIIVLAADAVLMMLGSWLGDAVDAVGRHRQAAEWDAILGVALLAGVLFSLSCHLAGLTTLPALLHPARTMKRTLAVCGFVVMSSTALLAVPELGGAVPGGSVVGTAVALLVICCLSRFAVAGLLEHLVARRLIAGRPVFLIGDACEMDTLSTAYLLAEFGRRDAGRLVLQAGPDAQSARAVAQIEAALAWARAGTVQEFMLALRPDRWSDLSEIEAALQTSPLPVRLMPHAAYRAVIDRSHSPQGPATYLAELQRAPLAPTGRLAKRVLDVVVAGFALVALLPVMVLAAAAIKLDSSGPAIFRQRRSGFDQREFTIFKFRTMHGLDDGPTVHQACRGDARITRVGAFLRRTSIDELPQLLNVLRGDMSLVGPRPHAIAHDQAFMASVGDYRLRHRVKPGITGWAQISGCRGETACPEQIRRRVELDLWYITHWSLRLDLKILCRTAIDVVHHDAY